MLPSSVRRVVATAPQSPLLSSLPRGTAATTAARTFRASQRRRYSSSKPSRDNGSDDSPVRQSVQPASEAKEAKTTETKTRKRKAKDTSSKHQFLPSVPTTAHIPTDCKSWSEKLSLLSLVFPCWDHMAHISANTKPSLSVLALSSFFSLHRPISVTCGLPRNITEDVFATIFTPQTRGQKATEVMSTLSRTVQSLEQPMARISLQQSHDTADEHHQRINLLNADDADVNVTLQINNMSGQFLPFRPPPVPQPESAISSESHTVEADAQQDTQKRVYKALFTIEETTDHNGEVRIMAHTPELIEMPAARDGEAVEEGAMEDSEVPQTFLRRMALRQQEYEDTLQSRRTMLAISVKRQRKLRMKKKKYKKLTKRLRHERLKHGRT